MRFACPVVWLLLCARAFTSPIIYTHTKQLTSANVLAVIQNRRSCKTESGSVYLLLCDTIDSETNEKYLTFLEAEGVTVVNMTSHIASSSRIQELQRSYKHSSRNRESFELFCLSRFIILLEFAEMRNISTFFHIDMDIALFSDLSEEYPLAQGSSLRSLFWYSSYFTHWTIEAVAAFTDYILWFYSSESDPEDVVKRISSYGFSYSKEFKKSRTYKKLQIDASSWWPNSTELKLFSDMNMFHAFLRNTSLPVTLDSTRTSDLAYNERLLWSVLYAESWKVKEPDICASKASFYTYFDRDADSGLPISRHSNESITGIHFQSPACKVLLPQLLCESKVFSMHPLCTSQ